MNIIFPIAGLGTRFSKEGFSTFKPFIRVKGMPIIEYAIHSLGVQGTYHIITRQLEKCYEEELLAIFRKHHIDGKIHTIDRLTSGAAETCLFAETFVNPSEPMMTVNCDQYTPWDKKGFEELTNKTDIDAIVTTFDHGDIVLGESSPYSFVQLDENGVAVKFAEKLAISKNSLNGIHYWKRAEDFFVSARELLNDNSVSQEKYISLTFEYMIKKGKKIITYHMMPGEFYALGTPAEVEKNICYL